MQVGILGGTGPAGSALATRLASVGVDVVIGSRDAGRAVEVCDRIRGRWPDRSLALEGVENATAAASEIVVVGTPWDAAATTAKSVAAHLDGKVVVSMANAVVKVGREFQALLPARGSVAAGVQASVPSAMVATAFQHIPAHLLADLDGELSADVLVCADDPAATATTAALVGAVPGLRALDAGSLANAGAVEAMTAVLLQLNIRYKARTAIRVLGVD